MVTEADRRTEEFLCGAISRLFPDANLVGEEFAREFDPRLPWTWVIDPIDGTDNYTQGTHYWCLSIGLLDHRLQPAAGIIYAPRLDLLLFADIGRPLEINGREAAVFPPVKELTSLSGLVISSKILHFLDLRGFPGKLRILGSSALQSCYPACYPGAVAVLQEPQAFAWDIAAAHAILLAAGCRVAYYDGRPLDYGAMRVNRWNLEAIMVASRPGAWDLLARRIRPV